MKLLLNTKETLTTLFMVSTIIAIDMVFQLSIFQFIITCCIVFILQAKFKFMHFIIICTLSISLTAITYSKIGSKKHVYAVYGKTGVQFCYLPIKEFNPYCVQRNKEGGSITGVVSKIEYMGTSFEPKKNH